MLPSTASEIRIKKEMKTNHQNYLCHRCSSHYAVTPIGDENCRYSMKITYVEIVFSIPYGAVLKGRKLAVLKGKDSLPVKRSPHFKRGLN